MVFLLNIYGHYFKSCLDQLVAPMLKSIQARNHVNEKASRKSKKYVEASRDHVDVVLPF